MANFFNQFVKEIENYTMKDVEISEGTRYSQYKLIRRLSMYDNQIYPKGKTDSQGNYKYWFDISTPRINSEIKNIDFDTKDIKIYSEGRNDALPILLSNMYLSNWLYNNNKSEELNSDVEEFSAWGNVVWKKVNEGYETLDLKNFYVLNQTAECLEDTDVIERALLTQQDLREKAGIWENVPEVIQSCGNKFFANTVKSQDIESSTPYYEIFERNGEISLDQLKEIKGEQASDGDDEKYVLAKVIVAGLQKGKSAKYVLFAEEISKKPYLEAHRGRYKGRWFREGLREVLLDPQTRANEIGNQIARGLDWASKTIFRSADTLIVQNALTDLRSGDIIKSKDLQQIEIRMQGLDQLIADWNRNLQVADALANSYEVVTGESMPASTPFRLGALQNQNANKLFDFLREKLSIAFECVIEEWVLPKVMRELRQKQVLEITGSDEHLKAYQEVLVNAWYVNNLLAFPPHTSEEAQAFKDSKKEEMMNNKNQMLKVEDDFWVGFRPRIKVSISGENIGLSAEMETLASFITLEQDPVRRTALIEMAMAKKGVDITSLPKSPPMPIQQPQQQQMPMNEAIPTA